MVQILTYFNNLTITEWLILSLIVNLTLYLFSISLYVFIDKTCSKAKIQVKDTPIILTDLWQSLLTVCNNSLVLLTGVYFMKKGWITLTVNTSFNQVIIECLAFILIMDFLMYIFHYLVHLPFIYKLAHYKHHEHTSTNYLSLFVLHPIEAIGFGLLMLAVLCCYNFTLLSISCYIVINVIWGTIGHLNREFFPKWVTYFAIGTSSFHNIHHSYEAYNFGFYTTVWDRIFKTYKK